MTEELLVAIIAAVASLVVAIVSVLATARTNRRVARLTEELEEQKLRLASELEEQRAVQDARRDYEYEARKRLYGECEPLLFEAAELAERARSRIMSIARTCRQGDLLPDGSGWLAGPGYYFRSTVCFLLAPMTSFKILQRRLTVIDLSLEPRLRTQYELLKLIFRTFTEDHDLARCEPELEYKPDRADPGRPDRERLLRQSPRVYRRQGLYLGTLETATEAMVKESGDGVSRCRSYGEFLAELDDSRSGITRMMPDLTALFQGFHPQEQPALWRVLVAQVLLYDAFLHAHRSVQDNDGPLARLVTMPSDTDIALLDWRGASDQAGDAVVREPVTVAHGYLQNRVAG